MDEIKVGDTVTLQEQAVPCGFSSYEYPLPSPGLVTDLGENDLEINGEWYWYKRDVVVSE